MLSVMHVECDACCDACTTIAAPLHFCYVLCIVRIYCAYDTQPSQAKAARADESPLLSEASSSDSEGRGAGDDEKRDRTVKPRLRNPVVPPKPRRKPEVKEEGEKEKEGGKGKEGGKEKQGEEAS